MEGIEFSILSSSASSYGDGVEVLNLNDHAKGKYMKIFCDHTDAITCSTMWKSVNVGNLLITGSVDKTLRIWDLDNMSCIYVLRGHSKSITCVDTSPDNAINPIIVSGAMDCKVIVWSILTGAEIHTLYGHPQELCSTVLWASGSSIFLFTVCADTNIRFWDIFDTSEQGDIIGRHHNGTTCLAVVHLFGASYLISGGHDGLLKVWDIITRCLHKTLNVHSCKVCSIAISATSLIPLMVSGGADGRIIVWDLNNFEILYELQGNVDTKAGGYDPITSLALSCDKNPIILSVSLRFPTQMKLWDSKTGGLLRILNRHEASITCISTGYCDVGPLIASSSRDGVLMLWSPEEDFLFGCQSIGDNLESISLEDSLVHVGRFLTYWNTTLESRYNGHDVNFVSILTCQYACTIFYCMIRMGIINPAFMRMYVNALKYVFSLGIQSIDLLVYDATIDCRALQFLFENKLCLPLANEWMKADKNIIRVVYSLLDKRQSSETLDSILSAVLGNERIGGWSILLAHKEFKNIFWNLMLYSPRSHGKIASLLRSHGLGVESDPYPSPLAVRDEVEYSVVRWSEVRKGTGIYCYRIRVNTVFPTDMLLSKEFFAALAKSHDLENLCSVPLIEYVVQYKWETWGYQTTLKLAFVNLVYLITTTISVLAICSGDNISIRSHLLLIICIGFSLICNSIQMALAMWEFGTALSRLEYISNLWNVSDIIMIILCHISIIMGAGLGPIYLVRVVSTLLTLVLWSRIIYFGRGEKSLAILIYTMKNVIWDVRYFLGLMFIFVSAYSISFKVLGVFDSLFLSFLLCVNMMLGDVGFSSVRGHVFAEILYLSFLVMVAIIMLNAFIAFIQASLDKCVVKREIAPVISRVKMLHELESKMIPIENIITLFAPTYFHSKIASLGDLIVLAPESGGRPNFRGPDTFAASTSIVIQRLDHEMTSTRSELCQLRESVVHHHTSHLKYCENIEGKLNKMEAKFDHLIELLSKKDLMQSQSIISPHSAMLDNVTPFQAVRDESAYTYFGEDDDANS